MTTDIRNSRIIFLNSPELSAPLMARIEALESMLRAKARSYTNDSLEADDIYAAMVDEILFKSKPTDSDARILTRAMWAGKAVVRRNLAYSAIVGSEGEMTRSFFLVHKIDDENFLVEVL